jgi:hypothetical protein
MTRTRRPRFCSGRRGNATLGGIAVIKELSSPVEDSGR